MSTPDPHRASKQTAAPRRGHYALAAVLITVLAVYGSLVPLEYESLSFAEAVQRFRRIPYLTIHIQSRADWVANILLFVPISFCWLGTLAVDRPRGRRLILAAAAVIVASAAASAALEFTQLWFPRRTFAINDILAETIGGCAGVVLWMLVGQAVTEWVRGYTSAARPKRQVDLLLEMYLLGLLIYSVLPLDLTIRIGELIDKYRQGRVTLLPLSDLDLSAKSAYVLLTDVAVYVPVGMLVATWQTTTRRPVRPMAASLLWGGLIAGAIEVAQLIVFSRHASTTDLISAAVGIAAGWWIMRRLRGGEADAAAPVPRAASARLAWMWLLAGIAYAALLVVVFCAPFDPIKDRELMQRRYDGFFRVPFAALYRGTEFNAVSEVLKKVLFFAPLGAVAALVARAAVVPPPIRRMLTAVLLLAASALSVSIEMAQVLLPPHVPDVTDVILCTLGAGLGWAVTWRMLAAREAELIERGSSGEAL